MTVEEEFERRLLGNLDEAEKKVAGYSFLGLRRFIAEKGAVATAKYFVDLRNRSTAFDGFDVLADHGLLRFSVERAVLDFADRGLFNPAEISSAETRLMIARNR